MTIRGGFAIVPAGREQRMALPIDGFELDRQLCRPRRDNLGRGLYNFIRKAWSEVESVPFVGGWHLEEVCAHLEAVSLGEIDRLIINIPPGMSKSLSVCVFWNVWDWVYIPHPSDGVLGWRKFMYASFDATLSQRDALRAKELVESRWFQERWGELADPAKVEHPLGVATGQGKQDTAGIYHVTGGGYRFSTSTGGKATGWHAHIQVVDDPTKPKDTEGGGAKTRTALNFAWNWWRNTMASRKADPKDFRRVIIMQRIHEDDLAGKCIAEGGWVHLRLPMEYSSKSNCTCAYCNEGPCITPWGGDRRTEEGELLCPERFDAPAVAQTKKDMGAMVAAAQLDQSPTPAGGGILKRAWMGKRWRELPEGIRLIQSWDCAFKAEDSSSYVVGQVWGKKGANFYLIDELRARMDLPATIRAVQTLTKKWPKARLKLVEDKANGPGVVQTLQGSISGLVLVNPQGGKVARANAVAPFFEAGNVWLPEREWVEDYINELERFPMGAHDDRVDATSQALLRLSGKLRNRYKGAMDQVRKELMG